MILPLDALRILLLLVQGTPTGQLAAHYDEEADVLELSVVPACFAHSINCQSQGVAVGVTTVVVPPVVKTLGTAPVPWMMLRKP